MRKVRGVSLRRWGVALLAALLWAPSAAAEAPVGDELALALAGELPAGGLRVMVSLRRGDMPVDKLERRARMRERIRGVTGGLRGGKLRTTRRFELLGGFAASLDRAEIAALRRHPMVEHVYLDRPAYLHTAEGASLIGAAQLQTYGVTGAGVNVAVVDTGVDFTHLDLASSRVAEHCFCSGGGGCCPLGNGTEESGPGSAADFGIGHGTSVAGIITADGIESTPGVAPDAGIVAVRVFPVAGNASFSDIAAALEWLYDNRVALDLRAVNLAVGDGAEHENPGPFNVCRNSQTQRAIVDLHGMGIPFFASSGNDAFDNGITFPACVAEAIAVGGVYDASLPTVQWCAPSGCGTILCTDTNPVADDFACHTNTGSLLDILTPDWRTTTPAIGGGSHDFGGTSASVPYAVGMAALLFEAAPALNAVDVTNLMTGHGPSVTDPTNSMSFPRTNIQAALLSVATVDADGDGISDDGDGSGVLGDATCAGGATTSCDDNCAFQPNPDQADLDADGVGDVCDVCPGVPNPGQDPSVCAASVPALSGPAILLSILLLGAALALGAPRGIFSA